MSTLRVDNIKSRTGTAVTIPSGQSLDVTGDVNVTGDLAVTGGGNLNTTGIITATTFVGNITGVAATFTGVVTYEDVTNVDSVGIVTARGGFEIGAAGVGGTITSVGNAEFAGIVTATSFSGVGGTITAVGNAEFVGIVTAGGGLEIGAAGVGGTITSVGNAEFVGIVSDSKGNVRNIPASTNSTIVAADAGKHISITAGITIDASTDFAIGDAVTIFNNQGAGNDETITATGITLYLATDATASGNRTLSGRGVATILCVATDTYVIAGGGLS